MFLGNHGECRGIMRNHGEYGGIAGNVGESRGISRGMAGNHGESRLTYSISSYLILLGRRVDLVDMTCLIKNYDDANFITILIQLAINWQVTEEWLLELFG